MNNIPFIENKINLSEINSFCAIIGEKTSNGARSPILWNRCFKYFNIKSIFLAFDVDKKNLNRLVKHLKKESKFLGGAITVPYKEKIIPYLDKIEEEAKLIGSVNLIYKKEGMIIGANTDGIGAVNSISENLNLSNKKTFLKKRALIIGSGGTAKSCAIYLSKNLGPEGKLFLTCRNKSKGLDLLSKCSRYTNTSMILIRDLNSIANKIDYLVNCTVIGFKNIFSENNNNYYYEPFIPLKKVTLKTLKKENLNDKRTWIRNNLEILTRNWSSSIETLTLLKQGVLILDVIYQPEETMLLKAAKYLDLKNLNGLKMNIIQAGVAFTKVFPQFKKDQRKVIKIMEQQ